ncbi:GntR family transcriptional regulator [Candidatus Bipolaricaulota bacterium]
MKHTVYEELKRRIIELDIKPGEGLNEKVLAEKFSVSRTPIREALIRLESDGLVKASPGRGTYATEISLRHLKEAYDIRSHLAELVGQLIVSHATPSELDEMEKVLQLIGAEKDASALRSLDLALHEMLNHATHNKLLAETLARLRNQVSRVWDTNIDVGEDHYFGGIHGEFVLILAAVKAKESEEVTRLLRLHLTRFVDEIIRFLSRDRR